MEEDIYLDKLVRRDIKPTAIRLLVIKEMMQACLLYTSGTIEVVKTISDLFLPVAGEVMEQSEVRIIRSPQLCMLRHPAGPVSYTHLAVGLMSLLTSLSK